MKEIFLIEGYLRNIYVYSQMMTVQREKNINYIEAPQHQVRFQNVEENEVRRKQQILKNLDIESSLESLCLQMMEHALGP